MRQLFAIASVGLLVFAAGCGGGERLCDADAARARAGGGEPLRAARQSSKTSLERQYEYRADDLERHMDRRALSKAPDEPYHVLVLSGGGSNGAWGAGFLTGWGQSGGRPKFDVVTGVSTGALISTAAFLGDDQMLRDAYTTTTTADVAKKRWLLNIPFSDSLYDTAPLGSLIERYVTKAVIERVAEEGARNRRLYVGTVNLDSGKLVIWDLTRIAAARDYGLYRRVIHASASIPVLYNPVDIGGAMYVDGGVRALLFFRTYLLPNVRATQRAGRSRAMAAATRPATVPATMSATAGAEPKPTIYVIVNGKIGVDPQCVDDRLLPIARRAVECLIDANGVASLYQTKLFAQELNYDFQLSYIPDDVPALPSDEFDPAKMTKLFDAGRTSGQKGEFFEIPDLDEVREHRGM